MQSTEQRASDLVRVSLQQKKRNKLADIRHQTSLRARTSPTVIPAAVKIDSRLLGGDMSREHDRIPIATARTGAAQRFTQIHDVRRRMHSSSQSQSELNKNVRPVRRVVRPGYIGGTAVVGLGFRQFKVPPGILHMQK